MQWIKFLCGFFIFFLTYTVIGSMMLWHTQSMAINFLTVGNFLQCLLRVHSKTFIEDLPLWTLSWEHTVSTFLKRWFFRQRRERDLIGATRSFRWATVAPPVSTYLKIHSTDQQGNTSLHSHGVLRWRQRRLCTLRKVQDKNCEKIRPHRSESAGLSVALWEQQWFLAPLQASCCTNVW